jgi:hypothetical protein
MLKDICRLIENALLWSSNQTIGWAPEELPSIPGKGQDIVSVPQHPD